MKIRDKDANGAGFSDKLLFKYINGPAQVQSDFGDVTSTAGYDLCIYEGAASTLAVEANVAAGGTCAGNSCWKEIKGKGYSFKDNSLGQGGIQKILLKGGSKTKLSFAGKEGNLDLDTETLPLDTSGDIKVRIHNGDNDNCWGADFSTSTKNDDQQFKAKTR